MKKNLSLHVVILLLLVGVLFQSCTPVNKQYKIKQEGDLYKFEIIIQSARFKTISDVNFKIFLEENGNRAEFKVLKTDQFGKVQMQVNEEILNKNWEIYIPVQEFNNSDNFFLPYSFTVKEEVKKIFKWEIIIPYNKDFLESRDAMSRTLYTRRVMLNIHPEWEKEYTSKIKSGNIEEGMTTDMIKAALGIPQNVTKYYLKNQNQTWTYFITPTKKVIIHFENGKATKIEREFTPSNVPPPVYN